MSKYTVRSIQEIKEQAEILGMPLEKMHFYVGEDSKSPKCFGIYKDAQGNTVVYKNKSDGTSWKMRSVSVRKTGTGGDTSRIWPQVMNTAESIRKKSGGERTERKPQKQRRRFRLRWQEQQRSHCWLSADTV